MVPGHMTLDDTVVERRSWWPLWVGLGVLLMGGWYGVNRYVAKVYPPQPPPGFSVITYGSDTNPSRAEQLNIFNQDHRGQRLQVMTIPGGSDPKTIPTTSAGGNAADVLDCYLPEDLQRYIDRGIAVPLNPFMKASGMALEGVVWPSRLDELRRPNPAWRPGDPDLDRHIYYAVPNNMDLAMVWFNRSLYTRLLSESPGAVAPPEPWLDWTWWDYAALGAFMQRRSPSGQFTSFGCQAPPLNELYGQVVVSLVGSSSAAFAALPVDERAAAGFAHMSPEEYELTYVRRGSQSKPQVVAYPNRLALAKALQFQYDLTYRYQAAPSASDKEQMSTGGGGFASGGDLGRFKGGSQGLIINGRWCLGQLRASVSFDWRALRMPRWVPRAEWERWQAAGMGPGHRDGPWGDRDPATATRGYVAMLGGRMSFISSSCDHPDRAFAFLRFLVENQAFNRTLLMEDGMGPNQAVAMEYLSQVDPLYPHEVVNRSSAHELGALIRTRPATPWPFANVRTDVFGALSNVESRFERVGATISQEALARDPLAVGRALSEGLLTDLARAATAGAKARPVPEGPGLASSLFFGFCSLGGVVMAVTWWRRRREDSLTKTDSAHG